ncbi:hypothetical protein FSP39_019057 [Pinctada imbricata]|uniref:Cytidyltransferase-like domain-containing protein n=1 Tax=Pinctada imbricata TaxID=66713 RepID=A0AA88XLH4_PINIB|nr:hypothetical protein FSP39_019057 [Pinctada imbricata]
MQYMVGRSNLEIEMLDEESSPLCLCKILETLSLLLMYQFHTTAFLLILFHDFLDHVDGIVAKAQRQVYGPVDDPILGGFMDAFCDKIVNVFSLWTILMVTDFSSMTIKETAIFAGACAIIIGYEFTIGVVRVQDYFSAYYDRLYKKSDDINQTTNVAAVMEGKLKEKLESMGIAFLCLSQSSVSAMGSISGITGVICLLLSVRLAHASLRHKLKTRQSKKIKQIHQSKSTDEKDEVLLKSDKSENSTSESESTGEEKPKRKWKLTRARSMRCLDNRVDRVYTVGCFDLFHHGHIRLLERMRALGKEVVVGVHDSRSIYQLKKKVPIDSTEKRMTNVKQHADIVFCVAGTDPTNFIYCIVNEADDRSCMYVRGDDMENFPARELCEKLMTVKFLPYSQGVSSTKLRKEMVNSSRFGPHTKDDGHAIFY